MSCPGPIRDGVAPGEPLNVGSATVVASARLLEPETGRVLARFSDWPEPYRFLQPPDPGLKVAVGEVGEDGTITLSLSVELPAKCVVLSVNVDSTTEANPKWSDNALDIVPGDIQEVLVRGLCGRKVKVAYFGKETAVDSA